MSISKAISIFKLLPLVVLILLFQNCSSDLQAEGDNGVGSNGLTPSIVGTHFYSLTDNYTCLGMADGKRIDSHEDHVLLSLSPRQSNSFEFTKFGDACSDTVGTMLLGEIKTEAEALIELGIEVINADNILINGVPYSTLDIPSDGDNGVGSDDLTPSIVGTHFYSLTDNYTCLGMAGGKRIDSHEDHVLLSLSPHQPNSFQFIEFGDACSDTVGIMSLGEIKTEAEALIELGIEVINADNILINGVLYSTFTIPHE
ncbi:hypothetical protein OAQ84_01930 [Bdellovibrionales bacterium]|nr:hypothetical protein [Bdellovibrionales bacterium]